MKIASIFLCEHEVRHTLIIEQEKGPAILFIVIGFNKCEYVSWLQMPPTQPLSYFAFSS